MDPIPPLIGSVIAGAIPYLSECERRVNRVFENRKENLAVKLGNRAVPWIGHESLARFLVLARRLGLQATVRMVRQNAACDRCKKWNGAERRSEVPSLPTILRGEQPFGKRFTDPCDFYEKLKVLVGIDAHAPASEFCALRDPTPAAVRPSMSSVWRTHLIQVQVNCRH